VSDLLGYHQYGVDRFIAQAVCFIGGHKWSLWQQYAKPYSRTCLRCGKTEQAAR
jgi:hypothetical protein